MTETSPRIDWPARTRGLAESVAAHRRATEDDGELDPSAEAWALLSAAERLLHDAADRIAPPEHPAPPPTTTGADAVARVSGQRAGGLSTDEVLELTRGESDGPPPGGGSEEAAPMVDDTLPPDRTALEEAVVRRALPVVVATLRWCTDAELRALEAVPDDHAALVLVVAVARAREEVPDAPPDASDAEAGGAQQPAEELNHPSASADAVARFAGRRRDGMSTDELLDLTRDRADDSPAELTEAVAAASAALRLALAGVGAAGRDVPGDPVREQLRSAVMRAESALYTLRQGSAAPPVPDELRDRVRAVLEAAGVETARADAWAQGWWVREDEGLNGAAPADLWSDQRAQIAVRAHLELLLHLPPGAWG